MRKAKELLGAQNKRSRFGRNQAHFSSKPNEPLLPYEDVVTKLFIHMSGDWMLYLVHE